MARWLLAVDYNMAILSRVLLWFLTLVYYSRDKIINETIFLVDTFIS
jgi:hypothetical protein